MLDSDVIGGDISHLGGGREGALDSDVIGDVISDVISNATTHLGGQREVVRYEPR